MKFPFLFPLLFAAGLVLCGTAAEEDGGMPASGIVITLNRMDPVSFSHVRHTRIKPAEFSCMDCHPAPFERVSKGPIGMEVPHETGGCAHCHNGKTAFAANTRCLTCHQATGVGPE